MKKLFLLGIIAVTFQSCVKSNSVIPDVSVNIQIAVNDPRISALHVPGGAVEIGGGVAGLILYREADDSYACYDRCSTVNPQQHNAVNLDAGNFTATDPVSGGKFSMIDGSPVKAPAVTSLKSYNVDVSGAELFISN